MAPRRSKPLVVGQGTPLSLHRNPSTQSRQFNVILQNLLRAHEQMQSKIPSQLADGENWYDEANEVATRIGQGDTKIGAGVIAAMSPRKLWNTNVRIATNAIRTYIDNLSKNPRDRQPLVGHTGVQLEKVQKILEGQDPQEVLSPLKEGHFYRGIMLDRSATPIDRHSHDVSVDQRFGNANRGLSATARFNIFARAHEQAAGIVGKEPAVFQSSTWKQVENGLYLPGKGVIDLA